MAGRPLRPATRRRLGRPLPHQQADRPRGPPEAETHFLTWPCGLVGASGISSGFPLLSRSSGQVPHVLLTRSPLGLLQCYHRMSPVRLACVKHAASVRPEPGSNSPSRSSARLAAHLDLVCRAPARAFGLDGTKTEVVVRLMLDKNGAPAYAGAPALAFDFSLFRFQGPLLAVTHVCWKQAAVLTAK